MNDDLDIPNIVKRLRAYTVFHETTGIWSMTVFEVVLFSLITNGILTKAELIDKIKCVTGNISENDLNKILCP